MIGILLYIDPGTGSMLFSLVIAVATTLVFAMRKVLIKLSFILSAGKQNINYDKKTPYVIYSDHKRYWNIFKPICDEFENRKIPLVYYTQSSDDPAISENYEYVTTEFIGEGNKGIAKMNFLSAKTVLSTTPGIDVLQWKRSKGVDRYVHIPHGINMMSGYRTFGIDHYDSIICNCQRQVDEVRELERVRNLPPKDTVILGCPYMDEAMIKVKELPEYQGYDVDDIKVIVAPTWGPSGLLAKCGESLIEQLLADGFYVIVRPHPQSYSHEPDLINSLKDKFKNSDRLEWNSDNDNLAVLNRADIMISDFSGVVFDFAFLMNRPVIMVDTKIDTIIYDFDWIDQKFWKYSEFDDLGSWFEEEKIKEIKEVIIELLSSEDRVAARNEAKKSLWENQGISKALIVDYLVSITEEKECV